jgi:hypothetical protein
MAEEEARVVDDAAGDAFAQRAVEEKPGALVPDERCG